MTDRLLVSKERVMALLSNIGFLQPPVTISRITEGSESQVWSVDDNWIFRIHTAVKDDSQLDNEIKLLELLRTTPLSKFIISCSWSMYLSDESWHCALYLKVRERSIEAAPESVAQVTENDLASLLRALKNVYVEDVKAFGIRKTQPLDLFKLRREASEAWKIVCNDTVLGEFRMLDIDRHLTLPHDSSNVPDILLHADLKGEHLFVDNDGRLTSVIDWTDACIGPPAIDIAGMTISVGATAAARIGVAAGFVKSVVEKGIFLARCNTVVLLAERLSGKGNSPIDLLRVQLRRAFQKHD